MSALESRRVDVWVIYIKQTFVLGMGEEGYVLEESTGGDWSTDSFATWFPMPSNAMAFVATGANTMR